MFIITLLLLDLLKENAYAADASVYCPDKVFTDNTLTYLTGSFNSSVITNGMCVFNVSEVKFVLIDGTSNPVSLCTQTFSTSPIMCDTNFTSQNCKCDNVTGEMFYYTYRFTTNASVHEGIVIELTTDCVDINGEYPLTIQTCFITFKSTTAVSSTTTTITTRTIYTSEATTTGSTTLPTPTGNSSNITSTVSSTSVITIASTSGLLPPNCENCNCTGTCKCPDNCSENDKCPVWCIVVSVCIPCASCGIIVITVIIIKKKKAKAPGNSCIVEYSEAGCNGTKLAVQDTKEMEDRTKNHGTENRPKPAQGGNNWTEESVQDTKEMEDKTKHLRTENSPEREKRRKKKKKKKPFQEVGGESVSRENNSIVNDDKAAQRSQNDNSVSVNENSPVTYNGELRRLPMPKTPHLTSVERNSTIFQSETPRRLPPLQLKQ